jgi:hypothetical protein
MESYVVISDKINYSYMKITFISVLIVVLGGVTVIVLAIRPKVCGFKPG